MENPARTSPPGQCRAPFNLAAHVLSRADVLGTKPALEILSSGGAEIIDYARLKSEVATTAAGLLAAGVHPGDRLLMRMGNNARFPIVFLAAIWVGIIPVPTSAQLTRREITALANRLSPQAIVADHDVSLPAAGPAVVLDAADLARSKPATPAEPVLGDPDRPAYIVFSSGTSGVPQGVVHAHRSIRARRAMWRDWYDLTDNDRLMHAGALNWTYTMGTGLLDPWTVGATALVPADATPPEDLAAMIDRHRATIFAATPGVYRKLLKGGVGRFQHLRHGLSAGEKLPGVTARAWHRATGTLIHEAYGMSECSTFISGSPRRPAPEGALGYPQPGRRVAIIADGVPVPVGQSGIIAVSRSDAGLMLGYLDNPDETHARLAGDWFLTGDMGAMDKDGAVTFLGRGDDLLNAGGFRVSPQEIEDAMAACPGIEECAAVEARLAPDTSVVALVYSCPAPLDDQTLQEHAAGLLARYKQPRIFRWEPKLPRSANGKLSRRALRNLNWANFLRKDANTAGQ